MALEDFTTTEWLLAAIAALCVGLAKSGLAGVGLITVLLMADVLPARESTGAVLPLLICGDIFAVAVFRKHAQWRQIWRLLPPTLVGIVAGYFLMQVLSNRAFRPVIGTIILVLVILQFSRKRNPGAFDHIPHARWFAWLMGGASGVTTMLANAAGPIATLFLLAIDLPKFQLVGTSAWFFLIVNVVKVPFSTHLGLINPNSLTLNLVLIPAVAAGIFVGRHLVGIVPQRVFEGIILFSAAAASIRLICF